MSRKGCNGGAQGFQRNGGNADARIGVDVYKRQVLERAVRKSLVTPENERPSTEIYPVSP